MRRGQETDQLLEAEADARGQDIRVPCVWRAEDRNRYGIERRSHPHVAARRVERNAWSEPPGEPRKDLSADVARLAVRGLAGEEWNDTGIERRLTRVPLDRIWRPVPIQAAVEAEVRCECIGGPSPDLDPAILVPSDTDTWIGDEAFQQRVEIVDAESGELTTPVSQVARVRAERLIVLDGPQGRVPRGVARREHAHCLQ